MRFPALLLQPYCNPRVARSRYGCQRRLHRVGRSVLHVWREVRVGVEGDGYEGVPEHLGDHLGVHAVRVEERSILVHRGQLERFLLEQRPVSRANAAERE